MTNGEKIKEIFPNRVLTSINNSYYWGDDILVSKSFWNAEYKEPSSSGKPNKSIEEKCPCYYCEHFEIKGLSHCKIHEDAYGDSRCNDYHKINQKPNKSEIPTGSITKNCESCRHYGLHHEICNYCYKCSLWKEKEPTTKNDLGVDAITRQAVIDELKRYFHDEYYQRTSIQDCRDCFIEDVLIHLPSMTPQKPRCKECKWWKDSDGKYRRGLGAESRCPINSHAVYCGDGYCYMFSPKIDMREVEK